MKTKKIQKQLPKQRRRAAHERLGALALVVATVVGMVSVEHDTKQFQREVTTKAASAFMNNSGRENELERMPVQYDSVLRLQTITGS